MNPETIPNALGTNDTIAYQTKLETSQQHDVCPIALGHTHAINEVSNAKSAIIIKRYTTCNAGMVIFTVFPSSESTNKQLCIHSHPDQDGTKTKTQRQGEDDHIFI